jgi:hypothetical protein
LKYFILPGPCLQSISVLASLLYEGCRKDILKGEKEVKAPFDYATENAERLTAHEALF